MTASRKTADLRKTADSRERPPGKRFRSLRGESLRLPTALPVSVLPAIVVRYEQLCPGSGENSSACRTASETAVSVRVWCRLPRRALSGAGRERARIELSVRGRLRPARSRMGLLAQRSRRVSRRRERFPALLLVRQRLLPAALPPLPSSIRPRAPSVSQLELPAQRDRTRLSPYGTGANHSPTFSRKPVNHRRNRNDRRGTPTHRA
jgi:hypothetical protein